MSKLLWWHYICMLVDPLWNCWILIMLHYGSSLIRVSAYIIAAIENIDLSSLYNWIMENGIEKNFQLALKKILGNFQMGKRGNNVDPWKLPSVEDAEQNKMKPWGNPCLSGSGHRGRTISQQWQEHVGMRFALRCCGGTLFKNNETDGCVLMIGYHTL